METQEKISPFQLTAILLSGRLFTVLLYAPKNPEAGSMLLALLLAPVVQFCIALLLLLLFRKTTAKPLLVVCWAAAMTSAVTAAAVTADFLADSFYEQRRGLLMAVLLVAAGAFAAWLGLEAVARAAPLVVALAGAGLVVLLAGAAGTMHLGYLPTLTLSAGDTLRLVGGSTINSFELLALPLLSPYATKKLKKTAIAMFLGIPAAVALLLTVAVMLALGQYAGGQRFPVYALARVAALPAIHRLDAVLMGIWVLLGLIKITVGIYLATQMWGRVFAPTHGPLRPALHAMAACVAAALLLSGCGAAGQGIGQKMLVTLLQVTPTATGVAVMAEYRTPARKDEKPTFGVYCGEGTDLWQALGQIEQTENQGLYLDNCRGVVVVLPAGTSAQRLPGLLEQLCGKGGLRPTATLLLCTQPMLQRGSGAESGVSQSVLKLPAAGGGSLGGRFTLKDGLACARDPKIPLLLPVVSHRGGSVLLTGFFAAEGALTATLSTEEAAQLPLWEVFGAPQKQTLPQTGAAIEQTGVYHFFGWTGAGQVTMTVCPVARVAALPRGVTKEMAAEELAQRHSAATAAVCTEIVAGKMPDIFFLGAFLGQNYPEIPQNTAVTVVVKPILLGQDRDER